MKKPESIELRINGSVVLCERAELNYYGGDIPLSSNVADSEDDTHMHVEVLPVLVHKGQVLARHPSYQGRVDSWMAQNEDCHPKLITIPGLGKCFVHVEVFAQ